MAMSFKRTIGLLFVFLTAGFSTVFTGEVFAAEDSRVSFHGYGELHYNDPKTAAGVPDSDAPARMDFHRMVWGLSYHYDDRWSLHTEIDFEHAANELELELAYLDYLINPAFNLRAGAVLMPVGPLNEFHEPPLFYSVERPQVETNIIPSTWSEGGVGFFGGLLMGLKYRAYLVSGLDASGFSASSGIRGGRGKLDAAPSEDFAGVGRLEYVGIPGLRLGTSGYFGKADQDDPALDNVLVAIFTADIRYRFKGLDLRGNYAQVRIKDAENIMEKKCGPPLSTDPGTPIDPNCSFSSAEVGEKLVGWYVEGAYDLLRPFRVDQQRLMAFARLEQVDTQKDVPAGVTADPENDRRVFTFGLAFYPIDNIALKLDQEFWKDQADNKGERFNAGIAYMF